MQSENALSREGKEASSVEAFFSCSLFPFLSKESGAVSLQRSLEDSRNPGTSALGSYSVAIPARDSLTLTGGGGRWAKPAALSLLPPRRRGGVRSVCVLLWSTGQCGPDADTRLPPSPLRIASFAVAALGAEAQDGRWVVSCLRYQAGKAGGGLEWHFKELRSTSLLASGSHGSMHCLDRCLARG